MVGIGPTRRNEMAEKTVAMSGVDVMAFLAQESKRFNPEHAEEARRCLEAVAGLIGAAHTTLRVLMEANQDGVFTQAQADQIERVNAAALARVGG
jgi:hypothetical protein